MGLALPHGLPDTPGDILGDGLAFRLGDGPQQGDDQLTVRFQGVNILLFRDHPNTRPPDDVDVFQAIHRVPGKPEDGFGQHQVDFLLLAQMDHMQELWMFLGAGAGDALIREDTCYGPLRVGHNFIRVEAALSFVAELLFFFLGGSPAVGGHTELTPHYLPGCQGLCRDDSYGFLSGLVLLSLEFAWFGFFTINLRFLRRPFFRHGILSIENEKAVLP